MINAMNIEAHLPLDWGKAEKGQKEKNRYFRVECIGTMPYHSYDGYEINQCIVMMKKPRRPVRYMQLRKALTMMKER